MLEPAEDATVTTAKIKTGNGSGGVASPKNLVPGACRRKLLSSVIMVVIRDVGRSGNAPPYTRFHFIPWLFRRHGGVNWSLDGRLGRLLVTSFSLGQSELGRLPAER